MPTEKQQWLDRYDTYYAATEYNRKRYGKRIKQLKHMLEDEKFLEFLMDKECREDILHYLAKSTHFDAYITYNEQGEPWIYTKSFELINFIKMMLRKLQSEDFLKNSIVRKQAKRYVEMYVWSKRKPQDELPELPF